jgi:prophage antirepressor-like protein
MDSKTTALAPASLNEGHSQINLFNDTEIRQVFHDGEWWFCVADVIGAITDSADPSKYLKNMRQRDDGLAAAWVELVTPLEIKTAGGKQAVNCAKAEGIFRIIQSIPSAKAEPLKRWIAQVAYERVQETNDPELAIRRAILHYQAQGRPDEWIQARIKTVQSRKELCDEWKNRGVQGTEYSVLSGVIAKETFGMTPTEHKGFKELPKNHNLRDHMTDVELILTMLGEKSTASIAQKRDVYGFDENKQAAHAGGKIAGDARRNLEKQLGESVVSKSNFLPSPSKRRLEKQ